MKPTNALIGGNVVESNDNNCLLIVAKKLSVNIYKRMFIYLKFWSIIETGQSILIYSDKQKIKLL